MTLRTPFTIAEIYIALKLSHHNGGDWEILDCDLDDDMRPGLKPRTRETSLVFTTNASDETINTKSHNYMVFSKRFNGGNSGWFVVGANPATQRWMGPVYDFETGE